MEVAMAKTNRKQIWSSIICRKRWRKKRFVRYFRALVMLRAANWSGIKLPVRMFPLPFLPSEDQFNFVFLIRNGFDLEQVKAWATVSSTINGLKMQIKPSILWMVFDCKIKQSRWVMEFRQISMKITIFWGFYFSGVLRSTKFRINQRC